MIAQALDLKDALEAVLYFCMEAVSAEAASVLVLDFEKQNFRFYSAEGPTKPVLLTASFPADQGLAGAGVDVATTAAGVAEAGKIDGFGSDLVYVTFAVID